MTFDQIQLARSRLRLGTANVGFWVLAAFGGLYWLPSLGESLSGVRAGILVGVAAVMAQAVFDFIGGCWLMPHPRPTPAVFLRRWLPGAIGHALVLAGVGLLSYASIILNSGFALAVLVASVALGLGRSHLLRMIGGASLSKVARGSERKISASVDDPAFTGGIVGFWRHALSVLPARWRASLPEPELAVESHRREWQIANGLPGRTFLVVLCWNLLGASIGTSAFELGKRTPAEALLGHACWMTLWAFASLLVLPVLSHRFVFAADRAAANLGLAARDWIARFAVLTGEDGNANDTVQTIFYPIPSTAMRLQALDHSPAGLVPGNLARSNLYYSWATLTLLGRAVHCNVGRPALWVFPPSA